MLKKTIIFGMLIVILSTMVACSVDNNEHKSKLTYKEEVEKFGNKLVEMYNAKEYEKICECWSQAFIKLSEKKYRKTYAEMKKDYKIQVLNSNLVDASVESIEIIKVSENERVHGIVMSFYYYNEYNKRCYDEVTFYVFKEGDKLVISDVSIPIEEVIELSKDKYDFASPVGENK